jgi:hypothetical protein
MPVFLRAFPLKDDAASVSKPRRPAERLREVRWQEDHTLDRLLIVADFGDGTSTIGSVGRARRPRGLSRVRKTRLKRCTFILERWGMERILAIVDECRRSER